MAIPYTEVFFGEKDRSHSVLSTSCDRELCRRLSHQLDLPGHAPAGFVLQSFVSCFPFENAHYVIARTSSDPHAARQGMVFSHAFIIPLYAVDAITDIEIIIRELKTERPSLSNASAGDFSESKGVTNPSNKHVGLAEALLDKESGPAVMSDAKQVDVIVMDVWRSMPSALRSKFSFRTFFSPEDAINSGASIICTPDSMLSRWPERQIVSSAHSDSISPAAQLICGHANDSFQQFLADLSLDLDSFELLSKASKAFEQYSTAQSSFADVLRAARLVGLLVPGAEDGRPVKNAIISKMTNGSLSIDFADMSRLRNFDTNAFEQGDQIWARMKNVLTTLLSEQSEASGLSALLLSRLDVKLSSAPWRDAFDAGIASVLIVNYHNLGNHVWQCLCQSSQQASAILSIAPNTEELDGALADQVSDESNVDDIEELLVALSANGFYQTEAELRCLTGRDDIADVIGLLAKRVHSSVEAALGRMLCKMDDREALQLPTTVTHAQVLSHAGKILSDNPAMFNQIDSLTSVGQKVWLKGLLSNSDLWGFPLNKFAASSALYFALIDGGDVNTKLLDLLAKSPAANILDFPKRVELWSALPPSVKQLYLNATAECWLNRFGKGIFVDVEEELVNVISSPTKVHELLSALSSVSLQNLVSAIATFKALSEHDVISSIRGHLASYTGSNSELESLGHVIKVRNWRSLVKTLASEFGSRPQLRPLFVICNDFLPILKRWSMGISSPSSEERWQLLQETAATLYSSGPNGEHLWEQAGGEAADVRMSGSGQVAWQEIIQLMRKGGGIRPQSLISVMLERFPNNPELQYLHKEGLS